MEFPQKIKHRAYEDFTGSPVVKTLCSQCNGCRFDPWSGNQDSACCTAWSKIYIYIPYEPDIPPLGVYPKEMKTGYQKQICILNIIAAIFTITRIWKQPKCLSVDKEDVCVYTCMYVYIHIYTMKYYSARRKKEIPRQNTL